MAPTVRKAGLSLATVLLATMISGQSFADNGNAASSTIGQEASIDAAVMVSGGGPSFLMIIGLVIH